MLYEVITMAWAVRPKSRKLLAEVNRWMVDFKKTDDYKRIYNKYFVVKRTTHILDAGYSAVRGGKVSEYDAIINVITSYSIHYTNLYD